jgi:hypothetical protein
VTDHQRRSAKLVEGIRAALDRGVSPERIQAELVRRNMAPERATLLLERIRAERTEPARAVVNIDPVCAPSFVRPVLVAAESPSSRRTRAPFFLAVALTLLVAGSAGAFLTSAEPELPTPPAPTPEEVAVRLDGEAQAARDQLSLLDSLLATRRVDAEQIEWLRARIGRGPESFRTPAAYRAMVARYEQRRESWNRTLPDYQLIANAFRTLAGIHNAKLDSLDAMGVWLPVDGVTGETANRRVRVAVVADPAW